MENGNVDSVTANHQDMDANGVDLDQLDQYTMKEVGDHCDADSCWLVVANKVYNVSPFLLEHPGGKEIILENAGRDATVPFLSKGHSEEAHQLLQAYCIGALFKEERIYLPNERIK